MYFLAPQFTSPSLTAEKSYAKANMVNGMYVFVESSPVAKYIELGSVDYLSLKEKTGDIGIGREKAGDVFGNIVNSINENLSFEETLLRMTRRVKDSYPEANGVMFSGKMRTCIAIQIWEEQ